MRRVFNSWMRGASSPLPIDPDLATPKPPAARAPFGIFDLSLVGVGGALGTLARYLTQLHWPDRDGHFPLTIFIVNVSGSFLLGAILSMLIRHNKMAGPRLFVCVGVLGGWTTMSTLAVRVDTSLSAHHYLLAIAYAIASVFAGGLAVCVGIWVTQRRWRAGRS